MATTGLHFWSTTAATNATADSAVNWAEGQAPSSVNDSARALMASAKKTYADFAGTLTTGGSNTAYTLATNQVFADAAAMSGAILTFIPHSTSGLNPSLSVDGLTGRQIRSSTGVNVETGALVAGTPYTVTYIHASTEFILHNVRAIGALSGTTLSLSSTASVGGATTLSSSLAVTGAITGQSTMSVGGNLTTAGSITAGSAAGAVMATQAEMEAESAGKLVAPSTAHFAPSAAKAYGSVTYSGGTPSLVAGSYNISGIADTGVGQCTVSIGTDMSSGNYVVIPSLDAITTRISSIKVTTKLAGSFLIICETCTGLADTTAAVADIDFSFAVYGDHA